MRDKKRKKHNPLVAAEMSAEGNYNQIDSIINNEEKQSVLERMVTYERNTKHHIEKKNECHKENNRKER